MLLGSSVFNFQFWLTGSLGSLRISHLSACGESGDIDFSLLLSVTGQKPFWSVVSTGTDFWDYMPKPVFHFILC